MSINNNSDQLNELLQNLSKRLGTKPDNLKSAAQSGNINNIIKNLNPSDAEKIQKALSDKNVAKTLLSSPQAQKLLKNFLEEK